MSETCRFPVSARIADGGEWASALGITFRSSKASGVAYPLCRALVAAGVPDGPIEFFGEDGARRFSIRSIHAGAKRTIVDDDERGIRFAKFKPFPGRETAL